MAAQSELAVRPRNRILAGIRDWRKELVTAAIVIALSAGFLLLPQFSELRSRIAGDDLWVSSDTKTISDVRPGEKSSIQFELKNLTERPITILGSRTSCRCTVVENLPMEIPAGASKQIEITVTMPEATTSAFAATLYFDGTRRGESLNLRVQAHASKS